MAHCWRGKPAISSYLLSLRWATDLNSVIDNVLRILPLILSWLSFWLLYSVVPTTRVPNRDAVVGALVAALLFELGKKGFALYITMFPSYQLIYGVLAVIPILFVWVYWTWCIVLLGAEITVTLGVYRELKKQQKLKNNKKQTNHDCIDSARNPCQRHRGG